MAYLPLFHSSAQLHALIVGGGKVATKRFTVLTKAGITCDLVSLECLPNLAEQVQNQNGHVIISAYQSEHLQTHHNLILAATNDRATNYAIAIQAKAAGLLVNVADKPAEGNIIFGTTVDRHPLTIAINNSGTSPILSRLLRQQLDQFVPKHYGELSALVGRYRGAVKEALPKEGDRIAFWENVLQGSVAEALFSGQHDMAEALLQKQLQASDQHTTGGEVYLIGAGPGDPDLLTLRAFRLLQQADVVLHDALVSDEILALLPKRAERIYVGKRRSDHSVPQEGINQLLVDHAKLGKRVARLKGGDPFVFGRGGEEIQTLCHEQIPFQVVPGITAANGCSAYAGIPLTHRDHAQSVRFVTGQLKNASIDLDWQALAVAQQTVVFYMSLKGLPIICQQLIHHGMPADMPTALIEKGTTQQQRIITSTIGDIPTAMAEHGIESPALLIVGTVVELHKELAWFGV